MMIKIIIIMVIIFIIGALGGAVVWAIKLQAGRSWVYISDGVIGIFHNSMALGSTRPVTEMFIKNIFWGVGVKTTGA